MDNQNPEVTIKGHGSPPGGFDLDLMTLALTSPRSPTLSEGFTSLDGYDDSGNFSAAKTNGTGMNMYAFHQVCNNTSTF